MDINSRQLEAFLVSAQTLSFTKTAEKLFTTQSTISRNIRQLEQELGASLFYRGKVSVTLTPAGHYFYGEYLKIDRQMKALMLNVKDIANQKKGHLSVGIFSYALLEYIYDRYITVFEMGNPEIEISYECIQTDLQMSDLEKFDLVIMPDVMMMPAQVYDSQELLRSQSVVVCGNTNPIAKRGNVIREDFEQQTVVTLLSEGAFRRLNESLLNHFQIENVNIVQAKNSEDLYMRLRNGHCIALLDDYGTSLDKSKLFCCELPEGCSEVSIKMYWKRVHENPALTAFVDFLSSLE